MEKFTAIITEGQDGYLLSKVVELPGCHTQGKNLDEVVSRTKEAISVCLKEKQEKLTEFIGLYQIEV